jgi:hypothetical protein
MRKSRPRKPGLDLSLWDRRPSGESRLVECRQVGARSNVRVAASQKDAVRSTGLVGAPLPLLR